MSVSRLAALTGRWPAATGVAALAVSLLVTLFAPPWSDERVGDLGVRSTFASLMLGGQLPYRDFAFEYPPLAAPAITLPGLAGTDPEAYRAGIAVATLLAGIAVVLLVGALARRTGGSPRAAMLAVAAAPLLLGAVWRLHFDLLPVALLLAALAAISGRRPGLGFVLLGLGALTKGFPLVAAPVAGAWLLGRGDRRGAVRAALALAATLAAGGAVWLALSPEGALDTLRYQLDRPIQVESSPASVLHALDAAGSEAPALVESHRSAGLVHPLAGVVSGVFALALALAVAAFSVAAWRPATGGRPADARVLVAAALGAVVAFAALGRVLSPQFLVWAVPLLALAVGWRMWTLAAACASACALTLVEFPFRYLDLVAGEGSAVAITAVRNAALLATAALALVGARQALPLRGRAVSRAEAGAARSIGPARPARPR